MVLFTSTSAPRGLNDFFRGRGNLFIVQVFPDKWQNKRVSFLWSGWSVVGWLNKWNSVLLAFNTTGSCTVIFIALGNQACVGQLGSMQTRWLCPPEFS